MEIIPKRVFISYAHSEDGDPDRVHKLADTLRTHGVFSIVDKYFESEVNDWVKWMSDEMRMSDTIVVVCNSSYYNRLTNDLPPGAGLGSQWEGRIVRNTLYRKSDKQIIIVQFDSEELTVIPSELISNPRFILPAELQSNSEYMRMYRLILGQNIHEPPILGEVIPISTQSGNKLTMPESHKVKDHVTPAETLQRHRKAPKGKTKALNIPYNERVSIDLTSKAHKCELDKDLSGALNWASQALKLDGKNVEARKICILVAFELGQFQNAVSYLPKSTAGSWPTYLQFLNFRVLRAANNDESFDDLARATYKEFEDEESVAASYATYLINIGDFSGAIAILTKLDGDNVNAFKLANISYSYWRLGATKEAYEYLAKADKALFDDDCWFNYGVAAAEFGFFGIALDALKRGIEIAPGNHFGTFSLAEILALMGRAEESVNLLLKLVANQFHLLRKIDQFPAFQNISNSKEFLEFENLMSSLN